MDWQNDPRFSLEAIARETAQELTDAIIWNAQSADDVPRVIEQIIAWMRGEWAEFDWQLADGYGDDPLLRGYMAGKDDEV